MSGEKAMQERDYARAQQAQSLANSARLGSINDGMGLLGRTELLSPCESLIEEAKRQQSLAAQARQASAHMLIQAEQNEATAKAFFAAAAQLQVPSQ